MEWQHPEFLYLVLPLSVGWLLLALYSERRRTQAKEAFVAQAMWSRVLPASSKTRFWTKLILREVVIITGLLTLAGPGFGNQYEQVVPRGSDLYVLIDVSRSMLADDVAPSRLERAKADVSALVNRLQGERIGLVAFAGQAVVKCPLTVDYDSFRRALNELDPNSAPRGGTAIGDAIRKALEVFHEKADRDQAVLLITDGDDQESYPLEAATVAAERKVTIFTVGLGDSDQGSRIPQKANSSNYVEHEGQQVWSKLHGKLLQEIAVKTSGIYIPAGTRAYDLGELYTEHLQGRKGDDAASQQRIRRAERFQIFLAITLLALLIDLCLSPYVRQRDYTVSARQVSRAVPNAEKPAAATRAFESAGTSMIAFLAINALSTVALAGDSHVYVREGLKLYGQQNYEAAGKEFAAAAEQLDKEKSAESAIAAFDEACAHHRKGDLEKARDRYLQAGLSQDRSVATSAHFNLGTMSAEQARKLAGERPDEVPGEKRQAILDELKQAVDAYRHCLELQPDHAPSRRNLELVRQWIKYYTDRWRELDRQKQRDDSNLIEFLEFLMQTQTALLETTKKLPKNVSADVIAELKRAQDELAEEIPVLRDKIESELRPKEPAAGAGPAQNSNDVDEGITLLQGWANKAGDRMAGASRQLARAEINDAVAEQQAAIDEIDRIWDAVIPFHPLLAKELSDQTAISESLGPAGDQTESADSAPTDPENPAPDSDKPAALRLDPTEEIAVEQNTATLPQRAIDNRDLALLAESQERTLRKARLLAPKAEAEVSRMESMPLPNDAAGSSSPAVGNQANPALPAPKDPNDTQSHAIPQNQANPEEIKMGYRKAMELAPKAVQEMEVALEKLQKNDRVDAAPHAEEARRILEAIQQAQPKNEQQNQDQKSDEQKKEGDKDQEQDEEKSDDQKSEQKKDAKSKDQEKDGKDGENSEDDKKPQQKQQPQQVSLDHIEEALRKVRERQQEKRDRDRETRARILGRSPVDKDW